MDDQIVHVQLDGSSWWGIVLPILAILISMGTLAYTIWSRNQDRARLGIVATCQEYPSDPDAGGTVEITVTNLGLVGATVVQRTGIQLPGGRFLEADPADLDSTLPKTLGPGESLRSELSADMLTLRLIERNVDPRNCHPLAVSGHGIQQGNWDDLGLGRLRELIAEARDLPRDHVNGRHRD